MQKFDLYNSEQFCGDGEIMQYSGINDHKDIEIYEGDILSAYDKRWKVIFNQGAFWGFRPGQIKLLRNMYCEVIGNIYETPKLLYKERE